MLLPDIYVLLIYVYLYTNISFLKYTFSRLLESQKDADGEVASCSQLQYIQPDFGSGSYGSFGVDDMKCSTFSASCQPMTTPSAPPPPSPTFQDDENGSLCLPLGLDTLLSSNSDTLEDVKGII